MQQAFAGRPVSDTGPCGARGRCRISSPRFLAECRKRRLNRGGFVSAVCRCLFSLICIVSMCVFFRAGQYLKYLYLKYAFEILLVFSIWYLKYLPLSILYVGILNTFLLSKVF